MNSIDAIARRVSLRELRLLLAVSRSGSILGAAREIGLTQPAVSKAIADLEETLNVELFDRTNRGVEPTPHGRILVQHAFSVLEQMRQAVEELNFLSDSTRGEVRIGGTPVMCGGLLSQAVVAMQAERPGIRYQMLELESERLAEEVHRRAIDIGVGRKPVLHAEGEIFFDKLFEDRLFVVAGRGHPLATRGTTSLGELATQCWVLPPMGSPVRREVVGAFERAKVKIPQSTVTTMSLLIRYQLLATNRFVTVLHGSLLKFGAVPGFLSVLPVELTAAVSIGISHLTNRTLSPASELFIANLRKIAGPMTSLSAQQLRRELRRGP